jgi:hypothetical protein
VKQSYVLTFEDSPSDYRLKPGEKIEFVTHLVGIKINNVNRERSQWEILSTFKWQLTNDVFGKSQVSLMAVDFHVSELSPALLAQIESDGGIAPNFAIASLQTQSNSHSLQCLLQNHQNRHLDSHL